MSNIGKIKSVIRSLLVHHQGVCEYDELLRQVAEQAPLTPVVHQLTLLSMSDELETVIRDNGRVFVRNKETQYA